MKMNFSEIIQELKWSGFTVQEIGTTMWRVQGVSGELPIGKIAAPDQVTNFYNVINNLVHELGHIAMYWRGEESQDLVSNYHKTMQTLWSLGWRGSDLLPDSELPDELMPKFFLDYWEWKNDKRLNIDIDTIRYIGAIATLIISRTQPILKILSQTDENFYVNVREQLNDLMKIAKNIQVEVSEVVNSEQKQQLNNTYALHAGQVKSLCENVTNVISPLKEDIHFSDIDEFISVLEKYKQQAT